LKIWKITENQVFIEIFLTGGASNLKYFSNFFSNKNDPKKISVINSWGEVVYIEYEIQNFQEKLKKKSGFY
jgi:hypothetical protein